MRVTLTLSGPDLSKRCLFCPSVPCEWWACQQIFWEYNNMLVLKLHALDFGWEMTIRVPFYPWLVGWWPDWGQHWWGKVLLFPLVPTFSKLDLRRSTIVRTCVPLFVSSSKHFGGALMLELLLLADVIGSLPGRRLRQENLCTCIMR